MTACCQCTHPKCIFIYLGDRPMSLNSTYSFTDTLNTKQKEEILSFSLLNTLSLFILPKSRKYFAHSVHCLDLDLNLPSKFTLACVYVCLPVVNVNKNGKRGNVCFGMLFYMFYTIKCSSK